MTAIMVILALFLGAEPDPVSLVTKLADPSTVERNAATTALETLGRAAIPALRAAKGSKDAELRRRAADLLEKIETGLLIRPTLVSLDFQDHPVAEVVQSISQQTGFRLSLEPVDDPSWQTVRISLREPRPLSFWEALDRLGTAGRLRHNPAFPRPPDERTAIFHLQDGGLVFPKCFSGPFRVSLLSAHRRHDVDFGPKELDAEEPAAPQLERFEVVTQVFAEPHLIITLNGPPKELKARDDFDQDLVPPPPAPDNDADDPTPDASGPWIERGPSSVPGTLSIVQFPILLRTPERPGTTIERLEGFIPLQVALRRPDPLVIALADAAGKSFVDADISVRFPDAKVEFDVRTPLELIVTRQTRADTITTDDTPLPGDFPAVRPVDTLQNRLDIVDAKGAPLQWAVKDVQTDDQGESRVLCALSIRDAKAQPTHLRVYSLVMGAIEVPFKFSKIPMP